MAIETSTESVRTAVRAEAADTRNWLDQHAAAPPAVAEAFGLAHHDEEGLVMVRSHIPFSHFNMVLTLGCPVEPDAAAWGAIDTFYGGREHWVVTNDHSRPAAMAGMLRDRGYEPVETWDRVLCDTLSVGAWGDHAAGAEAVDGANAEEWSEFVVATYGMPPLIGNWLRALVGRPGWLHAIRRRDDRPDGEVVMARSAFVDGDWAWLGIDAPIPGVMAPCFDDDLAVSAVLLDAAARLGARHAVTDIEAPSAGREGPAYDCWRTLGFTPAYVRTVHHRPAAG